jgi:hypothetical protein
MDSSITKSLMRHQKRLMKFARKHHKTFMEKVREWVKK